MHWGVVSLATLAVAVFHAATRDGDRAAAWCALCAVGTAVPWLGCVALAAQCVVATTVVLTYELTGGTSGRSGRSRRSGGRSARAG